RGVLLAGRRRSLSANARGDAPVLLAGGLRPPGKRTRSCPVLRCAGCCCSEQRAGSDVCGVLRSGAGTQFGNSPLAKAFESTRFCRPRVVGGSWSAVLGCALHRLDEPLSPARARIHSCSRNGWATAPQQRGGPPRTRSRNIGTIPKKAGNCHCSNTDIEVVVLLGR